MANDTVQARIPAELKEQAEQILGAIGLKTSEAIRLFLQQVVNSHGLPFQPKAKIPNAETIAAIEEAERGEGLIRYENSEELFKDLGI